MTLNLCRKTHISSGVKKGFVIIVPLLSWGQKLLHSIIISGTFHIHLFPLFLLIFYPYLPPLYTKKKVVRVVVRAKRRSLNLQSLVDIFLRTHPRRNKIDIFLYDEGYSANSWIRQVHAPTHAVGLSRFSIQVVIRTPTLTSIACQANASLPKWIYVFLSS